MKLFRLLNELALLRCKVEFMDDWRHAHCFTVHFTMLDGSRPFGYLDQTGKFRDTEETHTHTGFPDCTEEQGLKQLENALQDTIGKIRKFGLPAA
jgi:hypothetical protein